MPKLRDRPPKGEFAKHQSDDRYRPGEESRRPIRSEESDERRDKAIQRGGPVELASYVRVQINVDDADQTIRVVYDRTGVRWRIRNWQASRTVADAGRVKPS